MPDTHLNIIVKAISAKWKFILLCTLVGCISSITFYYYNPLHYRSTVSFMVDDDVVRKNDQNLNDQSIYIAENAPNAYRLQQMVKSTEMFDYLIEKFKLYDYYGISVKDPLHYEKLIEILKTKISISIASNSGMSITVLGHNKEMTANIANEMYVKLEKMIKEYTVANLQRKIKIYDQVLSNSKISINQKSEELKILLDEFRILVAEKKAQGKSDVLYDIDFKLANLSSEFSSVNEDLLKTIKNYEISVATTDKENLPNIRLINKALKDSGPSLLAGLIKKVLSFSLVIFVLTCIFVILNHQHRIQEKPVTKVIRPMITLEN